MVKKVLILGLATLLLAGCSDSLVRPRVERGIRDSLPEYIGPAKAYTVKADGSMTSMMRGRIRHLHIEGQDVQLDPKLLVAQMTIDMDEIRFNPNTRAVKSVKGTVFKARISQDSINHYIAETRGKDAEMKVGLDTGKVVVSLKSDLMGVSLPVSVAGKPVIQQGSAVNFVADSAAVAHLPMPAFLVNRVLEGINPVFDMSSVKFPVTLSEVLVEKGAVVIKGNAEFKPAATKDQPVKAGSKPRAE